MRLLYLVQITISTRLRSTWSAAQGASARSTDRNSDIAAILLSLERSKFHPQPQKDTTALNPIFDDGLMWVSQDRELSAKAKYLESLHDSATNQLRIVPESLAVKVFDRIAVVVGIYEERGLTAGRPYRRHCRFIDTWTYKGGKWVCIAAAATSTIS